MEKFVLAVAVCLSSFVTYATNLVVISADGEKTKTELIALQSISVVSSESDASLTVKMKDGEKKEDVMCIIFGSAYKDMKVDNTYSVVNEIKICPNPVYETIFITGTNGMPNVVITNLEGDIVKRSDKTEVNVSALPDGVYVICVDNLYAKFIKSSR